MEEIEASHRSSEMSENRKHIPDSTPKKDRQIMQFANDEDDLEK